MSFVPAISNVTARRRCIVFALNLPLPNSAPINPPSITANIHQGKPGAISIRVVSRPANPEIEFERINAEATPEITLMGAQCINSISGLRKTPPPTPVSPDRNPNPDPQIRRMGQETGLISAVSQWREDARKRQAEYSRKMPTNGL